MAVVAEGSPLGGAGGGVCFRPPREFGHPPLDTAGTTVWLKTLILSEEPPRSGAERALVPL